MSKNMYLDLHVLQTVPPSCVNRDDTGSPKTAFYGGTMRSRVSSQAWKRAMRSMFKDLFDPDDIGYRTRNCVDLVAGRIMEIGSNLNFEEAGKLAAQVLKDAGVKPGADKKDVLFFISPAQVEAVAKFAIENESTLENEINENVNTDKKGKKENKNKKKSVLEDKLGGLLLEEPSIDILLFGRMAADNPKLNYDAAAQVAHSISTHTVSNEYDYYTAVDDCSDEGSTGAAHLGTTEFNSSTLYRYATINIRELARNLKADELGQTVRGFTEAFIRSMPTGKQNSFANRTLPDLVYVTVRKDQPINLVGAFEKPVRPDSGGYAEKSADALVEYAEKIYENYVSDPLSTWIIGGKADYPGEKVNLKELLDKVEEIARNYSSEGE